MWSAHSQTTEHSDRRARDTLTSQPEIQGGSPFSVAIHKFITLSICSFGLYELYWFYQNWNVLAQRLARRLVRSGVHSSVAFG